MRGITAATVAAFALCSSEAYALVESKCVTPLGILRGLVEILPTAQDERRRPCVGHQTEVLTQIIDVFPSRQALQVGLVPRDFGTAGYTGQFRHVMGLDIDGEPDDHDPVIAALDNGLGAGLNCTVSGQAEEIVLSWVMATNERTPAAGRVGTVSRTLEPFEMRPNPNAPDRSWIAHVSNDVSGDDRLAVLFVPDMSIVGEDGSEIRVTDAQTCSTAQKPHASQPGPSP